MDRLLAVFVASETLAFRAVSVLPVREKGRAGTGVRIGGAGFEAVVLETLGVVGS